MSTIKEMEILFLTNEVRTALKILTLKIEKGESLDQTLIFIKEAEYKLKHLEKFALDCLHP